MSAAVLDAPIAGQQIPDNLDALVEQIVDAFPRLEDEQKAELGRLLAKP